MSISSKIASLQLRSTGLVRERLLIRGFSLARCCVHETEVLGMRRQEDYKEFKVGLDYIARPYVRGRAGDRSEKNTTSGVAQGRRTCSA